MNNPDYVALMDIAGNPGTPVPLRALPLFRSLQAELRRFDLDDGHLEIAYTTTDEHVQGHGLVAGGIIGTMLDFALSLPVLGVLPNETPFGTVGYTINLLSALRPGPVLAEGWIDRRGGRFAFTSARLTHENSDKPIIATGTSILSIGGGKS